MRGLLRRLTELVYRRRLDRETAAELAAHVELLVAHHRQAGLSESEARRRARLDAGSALTAGEAIADGRTGAAVEQLLRETRHAVRILRRSPALTLLSAATMAIGIGVSTVLFALVDAVVLRPLPYPDADRLVRIIDANPAAGIARAGAASGNVHEWRARAAGFAAIAGYYAMGRTLSTDREAEVVIAAQVTADFFAVAGVAPQLGHAFTAEETAQATFSTAAMPTAANPVAIIGHGLWRSRFGGDPAVVGRSIVLERRPFTVVGVMPDGFSLPD